MDGIKAQMNDIMRQIKSGMCVPFLGAAVNSSRPQPLYEGLPVGAQLAAMIFEELGYDKEKRTALQDLLKKLVETLGFDRQRTTELEDVEEIEKLFGELGFMHQMEGNLCRLALELDVRIGRPGLNRFLKSKLPDEECEPSLLLEVLARLPLGLIITTNYDCLMEKALDDVGKREGVDFQIIVQNFGGSAQDITENIAAFKGLTLYKFHGSFSENLPGLVKGSSGLVEGPSGLVEHDSDSSERVIITEDDYIKFLSLIGNQDRGVPPLITSKLTLSTLLFFGYSLEDWDFRVIYTSLIEHLERTKRERSYAFQKGPPEFWRDFWYEKGISIFDIDLYDFAEELDKVYGLQFSVGLEAQSALNDGIISESLNQEFEDKGILLSNDTNVSVKETDARWLITDKDKTYIVKERAGKLHIYVVEKAITDGNTLQIS